MKTKCGDSFECAEFTWFAGQRPLFSGVFVETTVNGKGNGLL